MQPIPSTERPMLVNVHNTLIADLESPEDKFGVSIGQEAKGFPAAFAVCAECVQLPAPCQGQPLLPVNGSRVLSWVLTWFSPFYLQC